jgi:hypothetical protein
MTTEIKARTFQRVAAAAEWTSVNPILGNGEIGVDVTYNQFRVGDGVKRWLQLPPVGVTVGQIEGLIDQYLAANPPAGGGGGSNLTVAPHPTIAGAAIITVSGSSGGGDNSTGLPVITAHPLPASRRDLQSPYPNPISYSVDFTANPAATVQWQHSPYPDQPEVESGWVNVPGATDKTYTFTMTQDYQGAFRAVVTNALGSVKSNFAIITGVYITD